MKWFHGTFHTEWLSQQTSWIAPFMREQIDVILCRHTSNYNLFFMEKIRLFFFFSWACLQLSDRQSDRQAAFKQTGSKKIADGTAKSRNLLNRYNKILLEQHLNLFSALVNLKDFRLRNTRSPFLFLLKYVSID